MMRTFVNLHLTILTLRKLEMKLERIYLRMTKIYCFQDLIVRRDSKFNLNSGIARHSVIIISLRYQSKLI